MIDQKTIEDIAKLARLKISSAEATAYEDQLSKVLSHFQTISKIDTEGVQPLVTPCEIEYFARDDQQHKEYSAAEMVANAPEKTGNLFKVPPVV